MKAELITEQAEAFKAKYGEWPSMPIRVSYTWKSTRAEGDIQGGLGGASIFGFPGMVSPTDEDVQELKMLHDAKGRSFPKRGETKP